MRTLSRFFVAILAVSLCGILYFALQPTQAQTGCSTQPAGAVAWYPGDGNANDLARGNNGTLQGNTVYAAGHAGQAFSFDGDKDAVSVGNPEQLRLQVLTIEAWVKRGSTTKATVDSPDAGIIFSYGLNGYGFYLLNNGRLAFGKIGVNQIDSNAGASFPELKITDTNFHHVAVVKTATHVTFYLDGVAGYSWSFPAYQFEFTTNAAIGGRGDIYVNSFLGSVDEVTVYNRALSGEEISGIHAAGATAKCKETRVQFERAAYNASEVGSAVPVKVRRTGDTAGTTTVDYATSDGTAKAGEDYTADAGTLTFAVGEQEKTINVTVVEDAAAEPDEAFQIALSNPAGAALGTPSATTFNLFNIAVGPGRIILITGNIYSTSLNAHNTDGSNEFQMTGLEYGTHASYPSVARQTGMIAFEGCGDYSGDAICDKGRRIFVMNGDGTNVRQVTTGEGLESAFYRPDMRPVISPDGTKVAFISGRAPAQAANPSSYEAWVVNIDGTGLKQITSKQTFNGEQSYAHSVVWSPDSSRLLVHAFRLGRDINNNQTFIGSLYTYNADGTGETLLVHNMSSGGHGAVPVDWSPDGRYIIYAAKGGPHHVVGGYVLVNAHDPSDTRALTAEHLGSGQLSGDAGGVRFSPDGLRIIYGHHDGTNASVRTINIDGTNRQTVVMNTPFWSAEKWWWPGAAIPQAARFELTPDPAVIKTGQSRQLLPSLYDAGGNLIFHGAQWEPFFNHAPQSGFHCDPQHPCSGSTSMKVNHTGVLTGDGRSGTATFCATNAGFTDCILLANNILTATLTTTTPVINKSGAGGPGLFRITLSAQSNTQTLVPFQLSGGAVRGVDYQLTDSAGNVINGNVFTVPAGQTTFDVKVVPVISQATGDRDLTLKIKSDEVNYAFIADGSTDSASITIKDDKPELTALSLSLVSPNKGGDTGKVSATILGANIKPGASVKLTRAGQPDITGDSVSVHANGGSLTTTLDLTGRARGSWSVVVTNTDGKSATLNDAFTVEAGGAPQVWADVVGRFTMRSGFEQLFYLAYGNTGNTDAPATKLVVTLPTTLFTITQRPEYPAGSPAFVSDDGQRATMELYVPKVAANSVSYLPFRLKASGIHINYEIRVTALTSPAYKPMAERFVDPNASVNVEVIEDTASSDKFVMHVKTSNGNTDIPVQLTETPATEPKEPTMTATENNGVVTINYQVTLPRSGDSSAGASMKMRPVFKDLPFSGTTYNGSMMAPGQISAGGSVNIHNANQRSGLPGAQNVEAATDYRQAANQWMRERGLINEAGQKALDGHATGTFINNFFRSFRSNTDDLSNYTNSKWADEVWLRYRREPAEWNRELGFNPNERDENERLSKEELVNRLSEKIFDAKRYDRRNQGEVVVSSDPNVKYGPAGLGTSHYLKVLDPMSYSVFFENKAEATAPAQDVVITDQLDAAKFDLSTFQLGPVAFGKSTIAAPPPGLQQWTTDIDLRPANNLIVRVNAGLNLNTGLVTWRFASLDPATMQPTTDPLAGFLPPNKTAPEGEGSVAFTISPKQSLATGDEIRNKARIVFDANAPIDTPEWSNTIDLTKPASQVQQAVSDGCNSVSVNWSGTDAGSGLQGYNVYVSENGGPLTLWKQNVTETGAVFTGQLGKSYAFYSLAWDHAGNVEDIAQSADVTITITDTQKPQITAPPAVTAQIAAGDASNSLVIPDATLGSATATDNCSAVTITRSGVPAGNLFPVGSHTVTYTATDASGNSATATQTVTVTLQTLIELNAATYGVSEDGMRATVTVNRSGDASQPATIAYATNDQAGLAPCDLFNGMASPRCDFAMTIGILRFAAGETTKLVSIPIINDTYAEGPETFTLKLASPSGASLGQISTATITINDNDGGPAPNPIDNDEQFIRQHYIDFLGREPEPAGLQGWLDILKNCGVTVAQPCDRIEVSSGFFRSEEFQIRGYFIYRFYAASLGRVPRYNEFMQDFAQVMGFLSPEQLETNKVAFIAEFMTRQEFQTKYGSLMSPTAYVDALLQTAGLTNHPARGTWIAALTNGTMTRAEVLRALIESSEVNQKFFNEAFVVMQYFGYLRREPDILYLQWIQTMNQNGGDHRIMINGFLNSQEYRQRFGP